MPLSTFHSLETAKSSLITHQKSLSVVSHNLANQANEDYSRQKVRLGTLNPVDVPGTTSRQGAGQVGQGVEVKEIERIRDTFVDDKIFSQRGVTNYWNIKESYLRSMESVYNEPGGKGVKDLFDNFLSKWNDVANTPTEPGAREGLRTSARELTNQINRMYESFTELRNRADEQIRSHISTINSKAKEIAKLNKKIEMVKADGKNPNDLMDRRDALIEDLSGLVNVNVTRKDNDFLVFIGSQILVQGDHSREVTATGNLSNKGMAQLKWADSGMNINVTDGEIKALMDVRDVDIVNQIKKLDNFAANLTVTVNDIHSEGFGLNGQTGIDFFSFRELSINPNGDYDSNGDGVSDSTAIMKVAGTKKMNLGDTLGIRGTINLGHSNTEIRQINAEIERLSESNNPMDIARRDVLQRRRDELLNTESITVEYFETDTVQDLIDRINASDANVVSYLNHKGQFTIKALHNEQKGQAYSEYTHSPDYAIKHLEDSGHFLTTFTGILSQQGESGAFDWENTGSVNAFVTNPDTGAVAVDYDVSPLTNPSSYISLSNDIERDINNIAARRGKDNSGDGVPDTANGVGDNSNALKIISTLVSNSERSPVSNLKDKLDSDKVVLDKSDSNFISYLDNMVQDAGIMTQVAVFESESNTAHMKFWENTRQEISGVSLDEELATMLTYEHAYRASAKVINVVDSMLETIINRLGV